MIVITLILSYFTLIFGELVPKRIAMQKPDAGGPVHLPAWCPPLPRSCAPVIWLLTVSTNGVLRLLRIDPNAEEEDGHRGGDPHDGGHRRGEGRHRQAARRRWIENVFEFDDMTAEDVMVHRTDMDAMLRVDDTPEEIEARPSE